MTQPTPDTLAGRRCWHQLAAVWGSTRRLQAATLGALLVAGVAWAQAPIPVLDVTAIAGKWKGPGGSGTFGNNPSVVVEQTNHPDGTYDAMIALASGQRVASRGTMTLRPDGSIAYEGQATVGVYRLYNINGRRVIRAEAKDRSTGGASWAELTEVK